MEVIQNDGVITLKNDGEKIGQIEFEVNGDALTILHTEVAEKFNGRGYGKQLVEKAIEFAGKKGLKVVAMCSYAKALMEKNKF